MTHITQLHVDCGISNVVPVWVIVTQSYFFNALQLPHLFQGLDYFQHTSMAILVIESTKDASIVLTLFLQSTLLVSFCWTLYFRKELYWAFRSDVSFSLIIIIEV